MLLNPPKSEYEGMITKRILRRQGFLNYLHILGFAELAAAALYAEPSSVFPTEDFIR